MGVWSRIDCIFVFNCVIRRLTVSDYPSCMTSENVVCKHVRSSRTFYVDLSFLPDGVTAISATADTLDENLEVDGVEVLEDDITVDESQGCAGAQLESGRALLVHLSGGIASDDEVIITVSWVDSEDNTDSRDCRILLSGTSEPV